MQRHSFAILFRSLCFAALLSVSANGSRAQTPATVPYAATFESGVVGAEWTDGTIDTNANFTVFSGRYSAATQSLALTGLTDGTKYTLSFDLYIIDSWDGGADQFSVEASGIEVFRYSFANYNSDAAQGNQSYPFLPDVGRVELGYHASYVDAIYRNVEVTFTNTGTTATIGFRGHGLSPISDESWGIDNVQVRPTASLPQTEIAGGTIPASGSTSVAAIDSFNITSSRNLRAAEAATAANYNLVGAGVNGTFGDGDDFVVGMTPSFTNGKTVSFVLAPVPLQPGQYRFTALNLVDANGSAVASYTNNFTVAHPVLGRIESASNDTLPEATTLNIGESPAGSSFLTGFGAGVFSPSNESDFWRLDAESGDRLSVFLRAESVNIYPDISLRNAANQELIRINGNYDGYALLQNFTISAPGTYYIQVFSRNNVGGRYSFRVDQSRRPQLEVEANNALTTANDLALQVSAGAYQARVAGAITTGELADYYRLGTLNIGNAINVSIAAPAGSDLLPAATLLSLYVEGQAEAVASSSTGTLSYTVAANGVHFIKVESATQSVRAQYLATVTITDGIGPVVSDVTLPAEGSSTAEIYTAFTVTFSEPVDGGFAGIPAFKYYSGHAYAITASAMTWAQAETDAVARGGHLVTVNDALENAWLRETFSGFGNFWIGFTDQATEGTFIWISGEEPGFTAWSSGEPNNSGGAENYAGLLTSGVWNDWTAASSLRGVMEVGGGDADSDGLPDAGDPYPADPTNGFELRSAGVDGVFGNGDDRVYKLTSLGYTGGLTAGFQIADGPLQPAKYRLNISTSIKDRAGNPMGSAFNRNFTITELPGFVLENTENGSIGAATSLSTNVTAAGDGSFTPAYSYATGANAWAIITNHFNSDVHLDVAVTSRSGHDVMVFLGRGDGTFEPAIRYPVQNGPISIASADFNEDGEIDLVVANYDSNSGSVLLGNGDGTFQTATHLSGGLSNPRSVATADLNLDGDVDLVFGNNNNRFTVRLGNGDGTFEAETTYVTESSSWSVALGDVNGDNKVDVVAANQGASSVSVLMGVGDGTFGTAVPYSVGANPRWVGLTDLNGDNKTDVVTLNYNGNNNTYSVLLNNGDGTFAAATSLSTGTTDAYQFSIGDFTGDGNKDLAAAGYGNNTVTIAPGNGDGTFEAVTVYGASGNPMHVAFADFNEDTRLDFITANYGNSTLSVYLGNRLQALAEDPTGSGLRTGQGRGSIANTADYDYWSFSGNAGDHVVVAIDVPGNPASSGLYLRILNSTGTEISAFSASSSGWGQSGPVRLPAFGTYFVEVRYNHQYFGEYRVRVTVAPSPVQIETENNNQLSQANAPALALNVHTLSAALLGYISTGDQQGDFYALGNLGQGSVINLNLRQTVRGPFDHTLRILDKAGGAVFTGNEGDTTGSFLVPAENEGMYYVHVTGNFSPSDPARAPGLFAQYLLDVTVLDDVAPTITSLTLPTHNSTNIFVPTTFTIGFSQDMLAATVLTNVNYELRSAGTDGVFGNSDDQLYSVECQGYVSGLSAVYRITDGPLQPGKYRFRITTGLQDLAANPLGAEVVREFVVSAVAGFVQENRSNNSAANATALSGTGAGSDGSFLYSTSYPTGANPWSIMTGKFNGDNHLDVAVGNRNGGSVTVYLGGGDGAFGIGVNYPVQGGPISMVSGDFNADSKLDLVVGNYDNHSASIMLGNGDGTFQTATHFNGGLSNPRGLASGDLNQDGKLDVVFGNNGGSSVTVFLGNGDGTFGSNTNFTAATGPWTVQIADVDGNGRLDIVTGNYSGDSVSVLLGNGNGSFGTATTYPVGANVRSISLGDLNGDSELDIGAIKLNNEFSVLFGIGDGTFTNVVSFAAGTSDPYDVEVVDVNGDGNKDLAATGPGNNRLVIALGKGDGTFQEVTSYAVPGGPMNFVVADVNVDGRIDVLTANYNGDTLGVLLGNGPKNLTEDPVGSGFRTAFGRGNLDSSTDVDFWSFSAKAGDRVVVVVEIPGTASAAQLYYEIRRPDGTATLVTWHSDTSGWGHSAPAVISADGTYYLRVAPSQQYYGEYRFRVTLAPANAQLEVEPNNNSGQSTAVVLTNVEGHEVGKLLGYLSLGDSAGDFYSLGNLSGATTISLNLTKPGTSGLSAIIDIINSQGAVVASSEPGAASFTYTLPSGADGAYYLRVISAGPSRPGDTGPFLSFDGGNARVETGTWAPGTNWTVQAWVRPSVLVTGRRGIAGSFSGCQDWGLAIVDGQLCAAIKPPGECSGVVGSGVFANRDTWYHVTATSDGITAKVYVNGQLMGAGPVDPLFRPTTAGMWIGGEVCCGSYFPGLIDDVRVWRRTLGDDEVIASLSNTLSGAESGLAGYWKFDEHTGTAVADLSGETHSGNVVGNAKWVQAGSTTASGLGFASQYILDVDLADTTPPTVAAVTLPAEGTISTNFETRFTITFSKEMSVATVNDSANYELRNAGVDRLFGNADDHLYTVVAGSYSSGSTASYTVTDGPLQPGDYRFTIKTGIRSRSNTPLTAPFVRNFTVEPVSGFLLESRNNNSLATATTLSSTPATTPDGSFALGGSFSVGTNPYGLALADFNGDTKLDAVTANLNSGNMSFLAGNGDGSFQDAVNYETGKSGAIAVVAGDFNKDGRPDAAVANHQSAGSVTIFLGSATGFEPAVNYPVGSNPRGIAAADFNGDGNVDLVVPNESSDDVSVLLGRADGTFEARVNYASGDGAFGVALGDFNSDGRRDMAVSNRSAHTISIFFGAGDGTFGTPIIYELGSNASPRGIGAGDLNGDGRLDLVTVGASVNQVFVFIGKFDGTFHSPTVYSSGGSDPYGILVSDLDGDGRTDVAVANYGTSRLGILLGFGDGTLSEVMNYSIPGNPIAVGAGNIDSDTATEVITANYSDHNISIVEARISQPLLMQDPAGSGLRSVAARGQIFDSTDTDYWSFSAEAGDSVTVAYEMVGNPAASGLSYRIFRPDSEILLNASADYTGWGQGTAIIPASGTYSLQVRPSHQYYGEYRLRVSLARKPLRMEVEDNDAPQRANVLNFVAASGKRTASIAGYASRGDGSNTGDYFGLGNIAEGTTVSLTFTKPSDSPFAGNITIRKSDGTSVAAAVATSGSLDYTVPVGGGGAYTVQVAADNAALGLFAQYILKAELSDNTSPAIVSTTLPSEGSTSIAIYDRFAIGFNKDMNTSLVVAASSYDLRAAGADGTFGTADDERYAVLPGSYSAGLSASFAITDGPLQPGNYRLTVAGLRDLFGNILPPFTRSFTIADREGFTMENRGNGNAATGTHLYFIDIQTGLKTAGGRGNLTSTGDLDYWRFEGKAGERVSVAVEVPGFPGSSQLYYRMDRPDGTELFDFYSEGNGSGGYDDALLPVDGIYSLRVRYNNDYQGEYNLRVTINDSLVQLERELNETVGNATPIFYTQTGDTRSSSAAGYVRTGTDLDYYNLGPLTNGSTVFLAVRVPTGSTLSPVVGVYNSANGYMTEVTGGRPTDGVAQVQIAQNGTYYAVVRGNDGSGGILAHYVLDVQVVPTGSVSFPNLQVATVTPPGGAIASGGNVTVSFTVRNAGSSATPGASWTDRVVLSANTVLGDSDDVTLGIVAHSGALGSGAIYGTNLNAILPEGISGQYHIIVQTDFGNDVSEFVLEGDNNMVSTAFGVTLAPYSDLKIENLTVSSGNGGLHNITWNTANRGQRNVSTAFKERVIVRNAASGITLLNVERNVAMPIAAGATIPQSTNVTVTGFGTFLVLVTTDSGNAIYEFDAVSHNSAEQNTAQTNFQVFQDLTVAVSANPAGAGSVTGGGTFQSGSTVMVTATPITNSLPYIFLNWTENGQFQSGNAGYSFTLNGTRQLVANFVLPTYPVSATAVPSVGGTIGGRGSYAHGATSVLTATPALGYKFVNWTESNVVVSTNASLTNVITTSRTFVANFVEANVQHVVTTETSPAGVTTIAGAGTYTNGAVFQFTAPNRVTNSANIYTFQEFRINGSVVSAVPSYTKTFSTLDPTNMQVVAVYQTQSISPVVVEVIRNFQNPAPATPNYLLSLRFDRAMDASMPLSVVLTNSGRQTQITVPNTGVWSTGLRPTDTYNAPAFALGSNAEGTNILIVAGGRDSLGTTMQATNAATVIVDATAPGSPNISLVSSNATSATFSWNGYSAPADLGSFRIYLQQTNFSSVTGIAPVGGVEAVVRTYTLNNLQLDTNYVIAVVALDSAGNSSAVNTLSFKLGSTVPPPVIVQSLPTGANAVTLSWNSYDTSALIGFSEFQLYYENTPFTSVAGLTPKQTLPANARNVTLENLDRSKTYYLAVVGVNRLGQMNSLVTTVRWSDPYSGTITANLTIGGTNASTVDIFAPITVGNNAILTITPGTTLRFSAGAGIIVQSGQVLAEGTALDPITFTSAKDQSGLMPTAGDWNGITLADETRISQLRHVFVKYGRGLSVTAGNPVLIAYSALYNRNAGLSLLNTASLETTESLIAYNDVGVQQANTARLVLRGSIIKNNGTNAWASAGSGIIATQNWWGTTVSAEIAASVLGGVVTTGNLTSEPVLTPAAGLVEGITQTSSRNVEVRIAARAAESVRLSEDSIFAGAFFGPMTNRTSFQLSEGGGQKTIFVQFRSVTGNNSSAIPVVVNYVTGGPVINTFNLAEGLVINRPFLVTAAASAPVGMRALELYINGQALGTNQGAALSVVLDPRNYSDAVHRARLVARDMSGSIAVSECNITIANTPPPAPVITTPLDGVVVNSGTFTITGTAEPNVGVRVTRNGAVLTTVTANNAGSFAANGLSLVEGRNRIVATAFDAIGSTPSVAVNVTLDTVAPEKLILDPPTYQPNSGLIFTWRFSPTGKQPTKYELFWNQTPFSNANQAFGRSLVLSRQGFAVQGIANGTWHFGVIGYDDVGNSSPLSDLVTFNYDAVAPVFTLAFDKSSPVGTGALALTLTANEALVATPSLTMTAQGAPPILVHLVGTAVNTYEASLTFGRTTPNGPLTFNVTGQDLAGNQFKGAPTGPTVIVDTQPPLASIITSPIGPVQNTNSTNVSLTLRTTEANGAGTTPTLSFQPPVGDALPITLSGNGTNWSGLLTLTPEMGSGFGQFSYSGTDAVGNTGTDIASGASLEIYNTSTPTAPNAPDGLRAESVSNGYVRLSWNLVTNAEIYRVYRDSTNVLAPTTMVLDNLTTNGAVDLPSSDGGYRYGVTASRRGAESALSSTVVAISDRTAPPAPTGVAAQLASAGVKVSWAQTGAETPAQFNVYRNGQFVRSITSGNSVTDYPPRGVANYTVGAVDAAGNEAISSVASISLLVGGVKDYVALVATGQPVALSWTSDDNTAVGFNIYRNGVKQNAGVIAQPNFVDPLPVGNQPVTYAVTAQNANGDEGAPRSVVVHPAQLNLLVNAPLGGVSGPLTTRYFDEYRVSLANLGATSAIPVLRYEVRRTVEGAGTLSLTRTLNANIAPGQSIERKMNVPQPPFAAVETVRVRAIQQGDNTVIYQNSFELTEVSESSVMISVSANQLPLAGGLATLQVQVFNRGFADLDFITATENGAKPGDVYVSVKNDQGQEIGRTAFTGTPSGSFFQNDGRAFVRIPGGGSKKFDIPNVLVAEALGTNQATFEVVVGKTYSGLNTPDFVEGGELRGSMISSLVQTPYYGSAETEKTGYADEEPIIITGQAIDRETGNPVPNAPLKIGFSARGFRWSRDITADATGNYSYEYVPTPGFAGNLNIWAAHPLVFDQLNQAFVTYYRLYPTPYRSDIRMSKNDTLPFSISLVNPGDVALTGFTMEFSAYRLDGTNKIPVTTVTGSATIAEGFTVGAGKTVPILLELQAAEAAPDNVIVEYVLRSGEGGSAKFVGVVSLLPPVPVLTMTDPTAGYLEVGLDRGQLLSRQITIQNKGLKELKGVTLTPPSSNTWIHVNLPTGADGQIHLPDIGVGESTTIGVVFAPPADTPLDFYADEIKVRGTNAMAEFSLKVYALVTSSQKGSVQFMVDNILGDPVPNASVRMRSGLLQTELPVALTDSAGLVTITDIPEGDWSWQVLAPGHSGNVGAVKVTPAQTVQVHTRLSKSLVTINFTVVPVPYTDKYEIKLEQTFETHVPAPVLVLDPAFKDFKNVTPGFEANFIVTVKNHGLIEMTDVAIKGSEVSGGVLTPLIEYFPVLLPQQTVEVPFVFTYNTPSGAQQGQRRQLSGDDVAGCLVGAMPFGGLANPDVFRGLAAIFSGQFRCIKDLNPQQALATVGAIFALGQLAAAWGSAAEFLVGFVGQALSCIIGNLLPPLPDIGIGIASGGGRGNGSYGVGNLACFGAGTEILMADGSLKPIEQIKPNEMIRVGPRSSELARVAKTFVRPQENIREIEWAGGQVRATSEHRFWVDGKGWVAASNLKPGDYLMNSDGERVSIRRITDRDVGEPVYTISVYGDNVFYANGVLVHDMCAVEIEVITTAVAGGQNAQ